MPQNTASQKTLNDLPPRDGQAGGSTLPYSSDFTIFDAKTELESVVARLFQLHELLISGEIQASGTTIPASSSHVLPEAEQPFLPLLPNPITDKD